MAVEESDHLDTRRDDTFAGAEITSRVVEMAGRRVCYLSAGGSADRQTILLIHGSGVSARYWVNQLRGLGRALRVLAIDLPGHGGSDPTEVATVEEYADTVASALDALEIRPVIAAGHSLGGAIAIALAARRPDVVTGLIVLSSCANVPHPGISPERFLAALPGPLRKIVFFSMAKKVLFARGAPPHAVSLAMQELRSCRPETILKDVRAARAMDLSEQAARLDVPALILCGSRDRLTPPALSEHLGELIARSRLRIIEGAGHMLLLEAPDLVNHEILQFVGAVEAPSVAAPAREDRHGHSRTGRLVDWVSGLAGRLLSGLRAR